MAFTGTYNGTWQGSDWQHNTTPTHPATPHPKAKAPNVAPASTAASGAAGDAHAILNQTLDGYGLGSLAGWAWTTYTNAGGGDLGMQVVMAELPNTEQFKTRFPAIAARQKAGLPPITVTDYMNYEQGLRQTLIQNGIALPTTGTDFNNIVSGLLTKDVSLSEVVNDRIGTALAHYSAAPDEVKAAFNEVYGVHGPAALASKILDPNLTDPYVEKLARTAELLGTGRHFAVNMSVQDAMNLATQAPGINDGGAQQFAKLAQLQPLFQGNVGEQPLSIGQQGVGFEFGTDAQAAMEVQRRLAGREAAFAGGGGAAVTNTGVIGLAKTPQS